MKKDFTEIIAECKNNNPYYQGLLYKQFYGRVFNIVYKYIHCYEEARDHTQDIFIKMFNNLYKFNGHDPKQFNSWFSQMTRFYLIDYHRKPKLNVVKTELNENIKEDIDTFIDIDDVTLYAAIQQLPEQQQETIKLFYLQDKPHAFIASKLNIKEGTSKSNLFKAKKKLRKILYN